MSSRPKWSNKVTCNRCRDSESSADDLVPLCVVGLRPSQSRRKTPPQPTVSITSYTVIRVSFPPRGSTKRRHHPPRLQSTAPCQAGSGGSQTGGNNDTCATLALKLHRVTVATLTLAYLEPAASVRGSSGMLGSARSVTASGVVVLACEGRPSL